mmetsp:Transcript_13534/g.54713  ORF Transcript_13534/g.54713 Transcript_13534/m.54713 type:complete len:385 (+) Transcript_13534:79-1233(+)
MRSHPSASAARMFCSHPVVRARLRLLANRRRRVIAAVKLRGGRRRGDPVQRARRAQPTPRPLAARFRRDGSNRAKRGDLHPVTQRVQPHRDVQQRVGQAGLDEERVRGIQRVRSSSAFRSVRRALVDVPRDSEGARRLIFYFFFFFFFFFVVARADVPEEVRQRAFHRVLHQARAANLRRDREDRDAIRSGHVRRHVATRGRPVGHHHRVPRAEPTPRSKHPPGSPAAVPAKVALPPRPERSLDRLASGGVWRWADAGRGYSRILARRVFARRTPVARLRVEQRFHRRVPRAPRPFILVPRSRVATHLAAEDDADERIGVALERDDDAGAIELLHRRRAKHRSRRPLGTHPDVASDVAEEREGAQGGGEDVHGRVIARGAASGR